MRYALRCIFFIFGVDNQPVGVVFRWFASATGKVAARRSGNGGTKPVGGSPDSPAPFVKTWVLTGSLGTPNARVEER